MIENSSIEGSARLGVHCLKTETEPASETSCLLKPQKRRVCQLTSVIPFSLLDFLTVENGTNRLSHSISTESPLFTVLYLREVYISHDDLAMHALILLHVVHLSDPVWRGLVQCYIHEFKMTSHI